MSAPDELLPCPFCGGAADEHDTLYPQGRGADAPWIVGCHYPSCGFYNIFDSRGEAITAWNRRADIAPKLAADTGTHWDIAEVGAVCHEECAVAQLRRARQPGTSALADGGVRTLVACVVRTIDAWDGPMVHPFDQLVTPAVREYLRHQSDNTGERTAACVKACEGLPQDALDGGWTALGLSTYAKRLETELAALRQPGTPCTGTNCGSTDDHLHSRECFAQHAATVAAAAGVEAGNDATDIHEAPHPMFTPSPDLSTMKTDPEVLRRMRESAATNTREGST